MADAILKAIPVVAATAVATVDVVEESWAVDVQVPVPAAIPVVVVVAVAES